MYVPIIIIVLFIVLGIIFSTGRGAYLIAGYNTLPKKEKETYDTLALCRFMAKIMFALSFSMVLWVLSDALEEKWLFTLGLILFIGIVLVCLIYANTGNRFKKS